MCLRAAGTLEAGVGTLVAGVTLVAVVSALNVVGGAEPSMVIW